MLVLNAAMLGTLGPVAQIDGKEFNKLLTLNLLAQQALIAAFDPLLRQSEAGRVIAMTSSVGAAPRAYWGAYGASKAALETLVLAYGEEVGNVTPIRVAIVDPGATATAMRARAFPGEDPATLKPPSAVADGDRGPAEAAISRAGTGWTCAKPSGPWSRFDQRHLRDVDAAAAEAAFAIHQIVAPQIVEGGVEAVGQAALGDRGVVARAPALQRLGIMEAVALAVAPFEAGGLGDARGSGPRRSACRRGRYRSG